MVWRWDSDPFGTTAANQDPDGDSTNFVYNLRFPGQYYDAETGLNYNYFRDYDSQTGRYLESDPIGLDGGNNSYVYAGQLPTMLTDPEGLLIPGAAIPYAKCIVECMAVEGAVAKLGGDACYTFTGSAGNCSISCLNPVNWVDPSKMLGMASKIIGKNKFGEGKKALEKVKEFRRWFHKEYKSDMKATSRDTSNPDMDLDEAYKQWIGEGRPKVD